MNIRSGDVFSYFEQGLLVAVNFSASSKNEANIEVNLQLLQWPLEVCFIRQSASID